MAFRILVSWTGMELQPPESQPLDLQGIPMKLGKCLELDENKHILGENLWDATKAILRRIKEKLKINDLSIHF